MEIQRNSTYKPHTIFTNPNGPYVNAPNRVRLLLDGVKLGQKLNLKELNLEKLQFPEKKTPTNFCNHISRYRNKQKFYSCEDCFESDRYHYCSGCFQPEKHYGHNFYIYTCEANDYICDCGKIDVMKKESICRRHQNYSKQIECYIPQEERMLFLNTFVWLIECCLQQNQVEFIDKLILYFNKLNEGSVYYNRLIFQFLSMTVKSTKKKYVNKTYLLLFIDGRQNIKDFIFYLIGDLKTRVNLSKFILSNPYQEQLDEICQKFKKLQKQIKYDIICSTVIERLIEEKFQYKRLIKRVNSSKRQKLMSKQNFDKFFPQIMGQAKNIGQLHLATPFIIPLQKVPIILEKYIQFYTFSKRLHQGNRSQSNLLKNQNYQKQFRYLFYRSFGALLLYNQQNALYYRQKVNNMGFGNEKIDDFLDFMIQNYSILLTKDLQFIILLLLIRQTDRQKEIITKIWKKIFQQAKNQKIQSKLATFYKRFYEYASIIIKIQTIIIKYIKQIIYKLPKLDENIEQHLYSQLRCLLYNKKAISLSDIIKYKEDGMLNFKNAHKTLDQLCNYNKLSRKYQYKSQNVYENVFDKFNLNSQKFLQNNKIRYGEKISMKQDSLPYILMQQFIKTDNFVSSLNELWDRQCLTTKKDNQSNKKCGYYYVLCLVFFDSLSEGSNAQIRQKLQNLKKSKQLIDKYSINREQSEIIKKLLDNQTQKQRQQSIMTQSQQNEEYKNQQCFICKKKYRQEQLCYTSSIAQNFIGRAFYRTDIICNITFTACFHVVHLECFINLNKQSRQRFYCPECGAQNNCILPVKYNRQNKRAMRICENAIKSSLILNNGNFQLQDSLFMIIFKHLIFSKGLNSLYFVRQNNDQRQIQQKTDRFLHQMMLSMYESSTHEQKQEYLENIDQLLAQIYQTQNQLKTVQLLLCYTFKQLITGQDQNIIEELLLQARCSIQQTNFETIKTNVSFLLNRQLVLPVELQEDRTNSKANLSLAIIELPNNAKDFFQMYDMRGKCQICNQVLKQQICLICGIKVCFSCRQKHSSQFHDQFYLYLKANTLNIICKKYGKGILKPIYKNQYNIAYQQKYKHKQFQNDNFQLDKNSLRQIINLNLNKMYMID